MGETKKGGSGGSTKGGRGKTSTEVESFGGAPKKETTQKVVRDPIPPEPARPRPKPKE